MKPSRPPLLLCWEAFTSFLPCLKPAVIQESLAVSHCSLCYPGGKGSFSRCQTHWIVLISVCYLIKWGRVPVHPTTHIFYFLSLVCLSVTVPGFLRWENMHKIYHFKHTVLWHYVRSHGSTTDTAIHIWKPSSLRTETLYTLNTDSHSPLLPAGGWLATTVLFLVSVWLLNLTTLGMS